MFPCKPGRNSAILMHLLFHYVFPSVPKDPTNKQTAYIDGSQIYGASCYEAAKLRSFRKGKMRVNKGMYGLYAKNVLLPDDPSPDVDNCDISYPDGNLRCLLAGDARVNQHPGLVALHTVGF